MYRNKNLNLVLFLLFCLLVILIGHVLLHVKIHIIYSASLGSIFMVGLIISLIVFLYLKG